MGSNNDLIGTFTLIAFVGQCYFQVTFNLNMLQQGKISKQRYYRNINTLSLCRPVLLSGNAQSEHAAAWKCFKQRYYRNINSLSLCRPVLLSGNFQAEHAAAGESVQTTILSEHEHLKLQ